MIFYTRIFYMLIFLMPWFNGLIEPRFFYPFYIILAVASIIIIGRKKDLNRLPRNNPLILLLLVSISSIFFGLNKNESIFSFYKFLYYLMFFGVCLDSFRKNKLFKYVLKFFFISASLISMTTIIFYSFMNFDNGINLVIDYPNTLAIYLLISATYGIFFLSLLIRKFFMLQNSVKKFKLGHIIFFYFIGIFICMYGLYLTRSRAVIFLAIISIPFVILRSFCKLKFNLNYKTLLLSVFGIALITVFTIINFSIFKDYFLNTPELLERFAYYNDALKIFKDFWLIGTGPGGWGSIHYSYQSALYASTPWVHSWIIQYTLDYGIWGLISFLFLIITFYRQAFLALRLKYKLKHLSIAVLVNSLIIFHSLIDFDIEFPLIFCIFILNYAFVYAIRTKDFNNLNNSMSQTKSPLWHSLIIFGLSVTIITSVPLCLSDIFYSHGLSIFSPYVADDSLKYFDLSIKLNPYNTRSYFMCAEVSNKMFNQTKNSSYMYNALTYYKSSSTLDKYNPIYHQRMAYLYKKIGDLENSRIEYQKLVMLQPLVIEYYEYLAEVTFEAAKAHRKASEKQKELNYLMEVVEIEAAVNINSKKIASYEYKLKHKSNMVITPILNFYISSAQDALKK